MPENQTSSKDPTPDRSPSEPEPESSTTVCTTQPRKRAPPFSRAELIFMVDFMEQRDYGVGERGTINSNKANILQDLRKELELKFGVDHLERQIQKRYSDLRTREKETYDGIRRKIARDKANEKKSASTAKENEENASKMMPIENTDTQMEIPDGEELITLTLEPIPTEPIPETMPDSKIVLLFEEKLVAMEDRLTQHMLQNVTILSQKMDVMCQSLENRIQRLEQAVIELTQKSILIAN